MEGLPSGVEVAMAILLGTLAVGSVVDEVSGVSSSSSSSFPLGLLMLIVVNPSPLYCQSTIKGLPLMQRSSVVSMCS